MVNRIIPAFLYAGYGLFWVGGIAVHYLGMKPPRAHWGAPAFLAFAAALVLYHSPGARRWLLLVGALGWLAELVGSTAGWPFGPYSYTEALQPRLAGVPVAMFCAWLVLIGYVKSLLPANWRGRWLPVLFGALWMTAIDLVIEPVAAGRLGYWRWRGPGVYFGVPLSNFAGWFLVSSLLLLLGQRTPPPGPPARMIGLSIVVFFGMLGAMSGNLAPPLFAVALSVLHFAVVRRAGARGDHAAVTL